MSKDQKLLHPARCKSFEKLRSLLRNDYGYNYGSVQQLVRYKTIRFNEQTNGLHVRYNFWYISLPYSTKQQHEMTKFKF